MGADQVRLTDPCIHCNFFLFFFLQNRSDILTFFNTVQLRFAVVTRTRRSSRKISSRENPLRTHCEDHRGNKRLPGMGSQFQISLPLKPSSVSSCVPSIKRHFHVTPTGHVTSHVTSVWRVNAPPKKKFFRCTFAFTLHQDVRVKQHPPKSEVPHIPANSSIALLLA